MRMTSMVAGLTLVLAACGSQVSTPEASAEAPMDPAGGIGSG